MHSPYVKLVQQLILTDASEDVGEADLIDRSKQMADRFNQRDGRFAGGVGEICQI